MSASKTTSLTRAAWAASTGGMRVRPDLDDGDSRSAADSAGRGVLRSMIPSWVAVMVVVVGGCWKQCLAG